MGSSNVTKTGNAPDLKGKFPKASFKRLNPGWAKETDVMYQITGEGMSGTIVVRLYDERPQYKEFIANNPSDPGIEFGSSSN